MSFTSFFLPISKTIYAKDYRLIGLQADLFPNYDHWMKSTDLLTPRLF